MAEQSTRYCNYSRDRFDNELSIMQPSEFTEEEINECLITHSTDSENIQDSWFRNACKDLTYRLDDSFSIIDTWLFAHLATEWAYMRLIKLGWKPQQARKVLNLDTASELVHTAFVSDWEHFFELRDAEDAHPDAQALAKPLHKEFIKRGYIK